MQVSMQRPVLIIGGGVAGSVCALRLRQLGIPVHLAEKAVFPRGKVCGCCLGGTGLSVLQLVGLKDWVLEHGQLTHTWKGSLGSHRIEIPNVGGVAISRERLDTEMLNRVDTAGVVVHSPVTAVVDNLEVDHVSVTLKYQNGTSKRREYELVVLASGLNAAGGNRLLPWKESPNGPFGVSFLAEVDHLSSGVIGMACNDDGYVGVVRLENDRVDVAAALASGAKASSIGSPMDRILDILNQSRLDLGSIKSISKTQFTPPLRRARLAGRGRIVAIGDASGYVEPFTGEGMTWGMMSGYELADLVYCSRGHLSRIGEKWCRQQKKLLQSRRRACRLLTTLLQSSAVRRNAGYMLSRFPSLASPLTLRLHRPWSPSFTGDQSLF